MLTMYHLFDTPSPHLSQNIENKDQEKNFPCKIFHPKELEVKIFNTKDLAPLGRYGLFPVSGKQGESP